MHSLYSAEDTAITEKVLFIDYDHCLTDDTAKMMSSAIGDKEVIIEKSCPENLEQVRYLFFLIEDQTVETLRWIEDRLEELKSKETFTLIMTVNRPTKYLFPYLASGLNGIVSMRHFMNRGQRVLDTLDQFGVFLEQYLHRDLVTDLQRKKLKDRPIKRLVLRTEDVKYILTQNEKKVLQHILDGHNNRKIAELMYLAPSTVSTVISHLLKKLGANDRTDAMVQIIRKGWVDAVR
ncbi:LuxR C-terminal-related transcriptional regulator [Salipaludibacillus sp. LMS25]|jgi:two-component system response regulator DegU|uniref:response regulator transcription factor n=1 Tax=Salipaludibacillus sp. LMS25 TaxID=2924031 RepID=UPI0020D10D31|nr:LuxR C-terminal-related transcriptional regulator [Salipaludibacillus sp. LMS25]UTR16067.1 LuxR C-terminal-related transcriptional regulator [Salipaludibacillus sp. LMS25]